MVSKFNIYTVHLKCFHSIRYNLNQYKTLTKNFNRTRTYVHTYIHTDTVKTICPHGDYRPRGHKREKVTEAFLRLALPPLKLTTPTTDESAFEKLRCQVAQRS